MVQWLVLPYVLNFVCRSLIFMGFLTMTGTGFGAYIMAMAALSPCPLLVHSASGTAVIVSLFLLIKWDMSDVLLDL